MGGSGLVIDPEMDQVDSTRSIHTDHVSGRHRSHSPACRPFFRMGKMDSVRDSDGSTLTVLGRECKRDR